MYAGPGRESMIPAQGGCHAPDEQDSQGGRRMGSEEQLRQENAELRAREERHREGLQRQLDLSRRLREYATHLRAVLREQKSRGAGAVFAEVAEVSAEALGVA